MLKSTFARVLVAGLVAAAGLTATLSANHAWGNYHWARTSNPFTLKVGDNVSAAWDGNLDTAISDWSQSSVMNLLEVPGTKTPRTCKPTAGRIEVCNATYGNNGWLGLAQIWASGDHITQATTKVNDTYFNTATYNTPAWRQMVMCQEIGHDFGLDHQDETFANTNLDTCMDYTNNPGSNQHPNAHDYEQLESIYGHLDSTTTVSASALPKAMPPAMGQINFDTPGQWGRLVSSSANGRSQVFELDFGQGNKVLTHVFWADPVADAR